MPREPFPQAEQVRRAYNAIRAKREAARYLHMPPIVIDASETVR